MRHIFSFPTLRFAQSARKHRIGKAHALHVIYSATPLMQAPTETTPRTWTWIGLDDRGLELEIIARELDSGSLLVIHVMPHGFRRNR